jgi:hypothetical protein
LTEAGNRSMIYYFGVWVSGFHKAIHIDAFSTFYCIAVYIRAFSIVLFIWSSGLTETDNGEQHRQCLACSARRLIREVLGHIFNAAAEQRSHELRKQERGGKMYLPNPNPQREQKHPIL